MNEEYSFLLQDKIDQLKLLANLEIVKNGTKEIYKAQRQLHSEKNISADATKTIEWVVSPLNQPLGYPVWFMAAYPDVVKWVSGLGDGKIISMIGEPSWDFINEDGYLKLVVLRKMVDSYKGENSLECC